MFEDLVKNTNHCRIISRLKPVDQRKLEILSDVFTAIPKEYMAFLQEVGAGELGNANYMLYEQIIEGSEIFTSQFCIENVYLFGDDFNGY